MHPEDLPIVRAADGMPVRPLRTPAGAQMGAAIGYLEPKSAFSVHFHESLEQLSIGISGRTLVIMQTRDHAKPTTHVLSRGDILTTPPMATLSFSNPFAEPAEIMFVCTPRFPSDGSGVVVVDKHGPIQIPRPV